MANIAVTRDDQGKLIGAGERHAKAYARFRKMLDELGPGEIFTFSYWFPRDPKLHGYHMVVLAAVFGMQEQWEDDQQFRKWVEVGAGYCDWVPGPTGKMIPLPKSIAWDKLDEADFADHHEKVMDFLRSPYCTRFLWPHLSDPQQSEMIEGILTECEIRREEIRAARKAGKA